MFSVVFFLPFISFLACVKFGWLLGRRGSTSITIGVMFITLSLVFVLFFKTCYGQCLYFITFGAWIYSDFFVANWSLYYDNLTLSMLVVVTVVSTLVHLYSVDYMASDPHIIRFMSYLSLFTFFMFLLVAGNNFLILFLGWEGVGLCSYLLINFWYTRLQANKAAIKALVVNRIADVALTIGLVAVFYVFKSLNFQTIFSLVPYLLPNFFYFFSYKIPIFTFICLLLFIGAMGKSAQIGLHTWLPDAMEGPTPVSALIHAATMVTAGVFLVIKCSPLFEYVPFVLSVVTFIGALTTFFSATVGLFQNDIKKVIAYSTCSQLGYMIFACGLSNYHVGLFHLINHAFFKALLFLSAGAVIHSLSHEQDVRKFGGLISLLPFTATMFLIGTLALIGFPFLTGFYSKDLILELALTKYSLEGSFAYSLGIITAFLTSFYSFRLFYLIFLYQNNSFRRVITYVHELPFNMAVALIILSLGSIFVGYFTKDLLVGLGTHFWTSSIFILPFNNNQLEAEFFGLLDSSFFKQQSFLSEIYYYNATYSLRGIKLLPFILAVWAIILVDELFLTVKRYHFDSWVNLMGPYFMEMCLFHPWLWWFPPIVRLSITEPFSRIRVENLWLKINTSPFILSTEIKPNFIRAVTNMETDDPYLVAWTERATIPILRKMRPKPVSFWDSQPVTLICKDSMRKTGYVSKLPSISRTILRANASNWRAITLSSISSQEYEEVNNTRFKYYEKFIYNLQRIFILKKDFWGRSDRRKSTLRQGYKFLLSKWYFDLLYNELINRFLLKFAYWHVFVLQDKGWLEIFGPLGISVFSFRLAFELKKLHLGKVYYYAYFISMFLVLSLLSLSYF